MQDKSSYSSNQPQISQGLQDFINAMVEEKFLKGESFEKSKKWLKKYSEAEGLDYEVLEKNLEEFFEAFDDYKRTGANSIMKLLEKQATTCFIPSTFLKDFLSKQSQKILPSEPKIIPPEVQFKIVIIGNQIWMAENLNVNRFRNGDTIPEARTKEEWQRAGENKQPAWCNYDNYPENGKKYGKLYNWFAVIDPRDLAPNCWRLPHKNDIEILLNIFGGKSNAFNALIKGGSSGFEALFSGWRGYENSFYCLGDSTAYWSPSQNIVQDGLRFLIRSEYNDALVDFDTKSYGYPVRCFKNV